MALAEARGRIATLEKALREIEWRQRRIGEIARAALSGERPAPPKEKPNV